MNKNFAIKSEFKPSGDQPAAINSLCSGLVNKKKRPSFTWCYWFWKNIYYGQYNS